MNAELGQQDAMDDLTAIMDGISLDDTESTTGSTRLGNIRRAIAELQQERGQNKLKTRIRAKTWNEGRTTKQLFRSTSSKFTDNVVPTLISDNGFPCREIHDKANTFADVWHPIFNQTGAAELDIDDALRWTTENHSPNESLQALTVDITAEEVQQAIEACGAGKACGPDTLSNDWYRDFKEVLTPILTLLFNIWYKAGVFPPSFLEADIFCLKKSGDTSNLLNYRPLALLNSDYKILTRIFATRIHEHQNGFVSGRQIHDTIDLFTAAQVVANADPEQHEAIALLLDFQKAYDSLNRECLVKELRAHGYPEQFVQAVAQLHAGTRVRFLVNGYRSRWVEVTTGIRQGCPLAPLLFILALDPHYRALDTSEEIWGVLLRSGDRVLELCVGGYADDTTVYLESPERIPALLELTANFSKASGLQVNANKTVVVRLHSYTPTVCVQVYGGLKLQDVKRFSRYLGAQVDSRDAREHTWRTTFRQLGIRLQLASVKTFTEDQRATIAAAVVIPKLLYIPQHAWPTVQWVQLLQRCIHNFVWFGVFTSDLIPGRAWITADIASLPCREGGMGIPDVRTECLAMVASEAIRWTLTSSDTMLIVGDILHSASDGVSTSPTYITVGYDSERIHGRRLPISFWHACRVSIAVAGRDESPEPPRDLICPISQVVDDIAPSRTDWIDGTCIIALYTLNGPITLGLKQWQQKEHGIFCMEWLPWMEIKYLQLFDAEGTRVIPDVCRSSIARAHMMVRDVVRWIHVGSTHMAFQVLRAGSAMQNPTATWLSYATQLVALLLTNFPGMAYSNGHPNETRLVTTSADHPYLLQLTEERHRRAELIVVEEPVHRVFKLTTRQQLLQAVQESILPETAVLDFHPHPKLDWLAHPWAGERRWTRNRAQFKKTLTTRRRLIGKFQLSKRAEKWQTDDETLHTALASVSWTQIRRWIGADAWGERLLYRLKVRGLSCYDLTQDGVGRPHPACTGHEDISLSHIFWGCPAAQIIWATFITRWAQLGHNASLQNSVTCFTFHIETLPHGILEHHAAENYWLPVSEKEAIGLSLHGAAEDCWNIGVLWVLKLSGNENGSFWNAEGGDCTEIPSYSTSSFPRRVSYCTSSLSRSRWASLRTWSSPSGDRSPQLDMGTGSGVR